MSAVRKEYSPQLRWLEKKEPCYDGDGGELRHRWTKILQQKITYYDANKNTITDVWEDVPTDDGE
jgi:hypothetical protein